MVATLNVAANLHVNHANWKSIMGLSILHVLYFIALSGTRHGYLFKVFVRVTMTHIHCQRMKVINVQLVCISALHL